MAWLVGWLMHFSGPEVGKSNSLWLLEKQQQADNKHLGGCRGGAFHLDSAGENGQQGRAKSSQRQKKQHH